ncbi:unnamed protein product, partial [Rotaria sp. Silwood2]
MNLVNIKLCELDNQLKQYQAELNKIRNGFYGYTLQHQHLIERYIEQNMSSLRMEIEHKIELIHYDYHIQALKLQYLRHNPNNYQKQLLKQLCRSKYEQEMTEQELIFLQQQITYYNSPSQSFENSPIAQSSLINSIENLHIRQQLFNQYKSIAENSKVQLSALHIKAAEEQRDKYKKKYHDDVKQIWSDRHAAANHEKIPLLMIELINERCKKIGESIQSIYKFKVQCFLSKPNLILISHMDLNMSHAPADVGQPTNQGQRRKKCHGNRKDQRFRNKCRAKGMKQEKIEELLQRNKEIRKKKKNHVNKTMPNTTDEHVASTTTAKNISNRTNEPSVQRNSTPNTNKRKRNVSLQQLNSNPTIPNSTKQELWNSYLDVGIQQHLWPDRLYTMAISNDFDVCHQYLVNYITDLKKQINQCQIELIKQSKLCTFTTLSLDQIDQSLNEFVDCQRNYLSKRNNRQLSKFKDNFHEKELFESVTKYHLSFDHNKCMNELLTIREKQGEIYEELLKFEMRILSKFLPEEFDHLQYFIAPMTYTPLNDDQKAIELKNNHHKIIQEAKRQCLTIALQAYNIKLQDYEKQYENKFLQLESQLLFSTMVDGSSIFNQIKEYMTYRTNELNQDIYKKVSSSRRMLLKIRQRSSSSRKHIIGVSPEAYLDLISNPFNTRQWNHLSLGPSCIRLNQSAIRPRDQQEVQIEKEHKKINDAVQHHLISPPHHVPLTSLILTTYSNELLNYFNHSYFAPISYQDQLRAIEQATTAISIRRKLEKSNLILRITDKGHNFYVGSMIEFEKKVQKFFQDTNAFVELTQNPFNEILNKVIHLLNRLREKNFILAWQYKKMMPDRTKCELAHLYFNPKTH